MSQAQLAAGPDRLPWLTDDAKPVRKPVPRGGKGRRVAAAAVALAVIAGSSYWLGTQRWHVSPTAFVPSSRSTTVALPPASNPQQQVQLAPTPEVVTPAQPVVRQASQPQVRIAKPKQLEPQAAEAQETAAGGERGPPSLDASPNSLTNAPAPAIAPAAAAPSPAITRAPAPVMPRPNKFPATVQQRSKSRSARPAPLTLWPARVSSGAYGRLVQIGAFGSTLQAKQGWKAMVRAYPGVSRLPAVVVETRNSRGRPFYRFQIGTTSQAHSEVLCQRMEKIRFSCAVVGLPQKPRGIER